MTKAGSLVGTPQYMSPEQVRSDTDAIGPHTDVWALGMIAVELLSGEAYWRANNVVQLFSMILLEEMRAPSARWPRLPQPLDAWFFRSCARQTGDRWRSVRDQAEALRACLAEDQPTPSAAYADTEKRAIPEQAQGAPTHRAFTTERLPSAPRQATARVVAPAGAIVPSPVARSDSPQRGPRQPQVAGAMPVQGLPRQVPTDWTDRLNTPAGWVVVGGLIAAGTVLTIVLSMWQPTVDPVARPAAAPSLPGEPVNLNGEWVGEYGAHGLETVSVIQNGSEVSAIKVTGDVNVPAGQPTFRARLAGSEGNGEVLTADRGFQNPRWVPGRLYIRSASEMVMELDGGTSIKLTRAR